MRIVRFLAALAIVFLGAWATVTGSWPWRRLPVAEPIVVSNAWTESADTLHWGETVSELLASLFRSGRGRHVFGMGGRDPTVSF